MKNSKNITTKKTETCVGIADRAKSAKASATLAISARVDEMRQQGQRIINFTIGEPDFNTPDYIIDAAKKALDEGKTKYTATAGLFKLRAAICEKLKRDNGLEYDIHQIVVSNGAKQALFNAVMALVNPGDEVIIPAPYWVTYPELVKLAGGVPVFVQTDESEGFKMSAAALKNAITGKTKAVIINSPNNPTGAVYSQAELGKLAAVIESAGIWVISDEIYEALIYPNCSNTNEKNWSIAKYSDELFKRTVIVNGFSKTYSMTGWRIGYSACCAELSRAMENIQSHVTSNINTMTQYAALQALSMENIQSHVTSNINTMTQYAALQALSDEKGENFRKQMVAEFDKRRKYMTMRLSTLPFVAFTVPQGAFYVLVNVARLGNGDDVAAGLLEKAKIAVVPGAAFGAPDYIRLCYTVSIDDIKAGMDSLESYLNGLKY